MPLDFSNLDRLTLGQLAIALQNESVYAAEGTLRQVAERLGINHHRFSIDLGSETNQRSERVQLMRSRKLFTGQITSPAVAAQFSFVILDNPVGSGVDLLVYPAHMSTAAASEVFFTLATAFASGAGSGANGCLNQDLTGPVQPKVVPKVGATAALLAVGSLVRSMNSALLLSVLPAAMPLEEPFVMIQPGVQAIFWCGTANTILTSQVTWAEVPTGSGYP